MTEERMTVGALTVHAGEKLLTVEAFGKIITRAPWFTLDIDTIGRFTPEVMNASVIREDGRLISVVHVTADGRIKIRSSVMEDGGDVRVSCDVSVDWSTTPQVASLRVDWINSMSLEEYDVRYPSCTVPAQDGRNIFICKSCADMPLSILGENGRGVSLYFDGGDHGPLQNGQIRKVCDEQELREMHFKCRANPAMHTMTDVLIHAFEGGWEECFLHARKHDHAGFDPSLYRRNDLKWLDKCVLGHFAFVYSEECYDYDTNTFRMDRVLERGKRFGGWDYVVLWNQYPRLGLDERHIWDMNRDFPGGMDGLRDAVQLAHDNGVRVFLPYMPWDRDPHDNEYDIAEKMKILLAQTHADGLFMDTMDSVPALYRKAADTVREGIVLLTENTPQTLHDLSVSQASWDQSWGLYNYMPEANRLRFLYPEHTLYECNRWHVGREKDMDIKRAMFNGMRFIVWEDIFGVVLPFDDKQAAAIARWKNIFNRYADCMNGTAVPLMPTCDKSICMNLFRGKNRAIAALYNASEKTFSGSAAEIKGFTSCRSVCGGYLSAYRDGKLYIDIPAEEVALVELL